MTRRSHLDDLTQDFITQQTAIGKALRDDMCGACASDAGTPFPEGCRGLFQGTCHWCGQSDKALMPVAELEAMEGA